jgi:hypothetical protein
MLALKLGKTVQELLNNITLTELNYWIEYLYINSNPEIRKELKLKFDEEFRKQETEKEQAKVKNSFLAFINKGK